MWQYTTAHPLHRPIFSHFALLSFVFCRGSLLCKLLRRKYLLWRSTELYGKILTEDSKNMLTMVRGTHQTVPFLLFWEQKVESNILQRVCLYRSKNFKLETSQYPRAFSFESHNRFMPPPSLKIWLGEEWVWAQNGHAWFRKYLSYISLLNYALYKELYVDLVTSIIN
jgi:hypothetical protein